MTCIAAVKKGGKVAIGGDSLLTTGSDKKSGVRKITKFPGCYVGFAGMYAIRHSLDNLARDEDFLSTFKMDCIEDARDLARRVFSDLTEEMESRNATLDIDETALLVVTSKYIFEVDADITCIEHDDFTAIGSGSRLAKAVFKVLERDPLTDALESCRIAITVSTELDSYCGLPMYVYEVLDEPVAPKPKPAKTAKSKSKAPRPSKPKSVEGLRNISRSTESDSSASRPGKSRPKPKVPKRSTK